MQVLLRSTRTKLYLNGADRWTPDRSGARNFVSGAQAILFAQENRLTDLEVVLAFDDPAYDVTLPLRLSGER